MKEMPYIVILILIVLCYIYRSQCNAYEKEHKSLYALREKIRTTDAEAIRVLSEKENIVDEKTKLLQTLMTSSIKNYSYVATILADYELAKDYAREYYLGNKKYPALHARDMVAQSRAEKAELIAQNYAYKWEIESIRSLFPWVSELENIPTEKIPVDGQNLVNITCSKAYSALHKVAELAEREDCLNELASKLEKQKYEIIDQRLELEQKKIAIEEKIRENEEMIRQKTDELSALLVQREAASEEKIRKNEEEHKKRIEELDTEIKRKQEETEQQIKRNEREAERILNEISVSTGRKLEKIKKDFEEKEWFYNQLTEKKIKEFPFIAEVIADFEGAKDKARADLLRTKKSPSVKGADMVKEISKEKQILIKENKALKWELMYLKNLLPWLEELEEAPAEPIVDETENEIKASDDAARKWLSPDEYRSLPVVEKYQLALDHYNNRRKSKAEIGKEYELYIGYLYEQKGYTVEYFGIEKGLEDLGRDLICKKDDEILIIQCKCWSNLQHKVIHEKHINQLYGTSAMWKYQHPDELLAVVKPIFCSTVPYSDTAKAFAEYLGIECLQVPLDKYPQIKCNIGNKDEKIYHLPFDQQYNSCRIEPEKGECFVFTVKEAEELGFRRAKKWLAGGLI